MKLEDEIQQSVFSSVYHKLAINITYTGNWMNALSEARFKPYGLTTQQFNILRILRGQYPKPARISLLQERMLDKMSNVSRLVEKLRRKGLLERTTCPTDRRAVDVVITSKGLDLLGEIDEHEQEWLAELKTLSPEKAAQLNELLDELRD